MPRGKPLAGTRKKGGGAKPSLPLSDTPRKARSVYSSEEEFAWVKKRLARRRRLTRFLTELREKQK